MEYDTQGFIMRQARIAGLKEAAEIADRDCRSCDCCAVMAGNAIRARIAELEKGR